MEAEKTRIYRKVAPDDRGTRWLSTIIRRCAGSSNQTCSRRRNAENKEARKESVTEELYKETKAF
jgi:hypothetical protein